MEREIRTKELLLDQKGRLKTKGYAVRSNIVYNRKRVRSFPLRLKEWDFYQLLKDHYVLQMTIGHVSYVCSVSATLLDLNTGKRYETGTMRPFFVPRLETDPEGNSKTSYRGKNLQMEFTVRPDRRILRMKSKGTGNRDAQVALAIQNDPRNEKMVIATPFFRSTQFYFNYKENYYNTVGKVRFGDLTVDFTGATGLLDWGRGVWPYSHEWYWGSLSARIEGAPFGMNIGWGFGDLSNATENMYFYKKKAYKIHGLTVEYDKDDCMKPWKLRDEENRISLTFTPFFDNYTENRMVVVDTHCDQVYGKFDGTVRTEEGQIRLSGITGFIEHAVNRW